MVDFPCHVRFPGVYISPCCNVKASRQHTIQSDFLVPENSDLVANTHLSTTQVFNFWVIHKMVAQKSLTFYFKGVWRGENNFFSHWSSPKDRCRYVLRTSGLSRTNRTWPIRIWKIGPINSYERSLGKGVYRFLGPINLSTEVIDFRRGWDWFHDKTLNFIPWPQKTPYSLPNTCWGEWKVFLGRVFLGVEKTSPHGRCLFVAASVWERMVRDCLWARKKPTVLEEVFMVNQKPGF